MHRFSSVVLALAVLVSLAVAAPQDDAAATLPSVRVYRVFPKLDFDRPIQITHANDGSDRLFVAEQFGKIKIVEGDDPAKAPLFLDLRDAVFMRHNEEGLLDLVFHPKYADNGQFFVAYTASRPRRLVISRFEVSADDPNVADPASEEVIMQVPQPYGNHNGAVAVFGPDGYLYISIGDGGHANDPHGHGQNLATLLGTVVRIDVDNPEEDAAYSIPADNPFVGHDVARPEIWAYGLRNVWRMSFDRETGELWGGDVGQNKWEEIDIITKGGNYGWNIREGAHDFLPKETDDTLIDPIVEYGRAEGISVTGGFVYRGSEMPRLQGAYIYADYQSGRIWGLRRNDDGTVTNRELNVRAERKHVASFGEGPNGELYICAFDKLDGKSGRIWRLKTR